MKTPSTETERHVQLRALTKRHLEQLTRDDLKALSEFADRRFGSLPRTQFSGEDAVQKALFSIVLGTSKSGLGRQPKAEHLVTKGAFLHYVRSAINSVIEGFGRARELLYFHESIHQQQDSEQERHAMLLLRSVAEADADAGMVDLKRELFERIRKNAARKLLPVIDEWEKTFFWATHVPYRCNRDYVRQVRVLAMRTLKELAEELRR